MKINDQGNNALKVSNLVKELKDCKMQVEKLQVSNFNHFISQNFGRYSHFFLKTSTFNTTHISWRIRTYHGGK